MDGQKIITFLKHTGAIYVAVKTGQFIGRVEGVVWRDRFDEANK
jgi:hypothetical protein